MNRFVAALAAVVALAVVSLGFVGNQPLSGFRLIDGDFVNGLANGQNDGFSNGVIAHAGGGQAACTQLASVALISVDTVASGGDSVCLPIASAGTRMWVSNNTATSMNVFASATPNPGNAAALDKIGTNSNVTATAVGGNSGTWFISAKTGQWYTK